MRNRHTGPEAAKSRSQKRRGIATVELLIALPLITAAFATLMFIAHASHQKNGDYHRLYLTGMSRHTLQPPEFDSTQTTHLEKTELNQTGNLVSRAFPATEMWTGNVSQPLSYVPGNMSQDDWETAEFSGALYKGTGSPEYRTGGMISPPDDRVRELAISAIADSLGNKLGINLSQANRFLELLSALTGSQFDDLLAEAKQLGLESDLLAEIQDLQVGDLENETQKTVRAAIQELDKQREILEAEHRELTAYRDSIDPETGEIDPATATEIDRLETTITDLKNEKNKLISDLEKAGELVSSIHQALENLGKSEN